MPFLLVQQEELWAVKPPHHMTSACFPLSLEFNPFCIRKLGHFAQQNSVHSHTSQTPGRDSRSDLGARVSNPTMWHQCSLVEHSHTWLDLCSDTALDWLHSPLQVYLTHWARQGFPLALCFWWWWLSSQVGLLEKNTISFCMCKKSWCQSLLTSLCSHHGRLFHNSADQRREPVRDQQLPVAGAADLWSPGFPGVVYSAVSIPFYWWVVSNKQK